VNPQRPSLAELELVPRGLCRAGRALLFAPLAAHAASAPPVIDIPSVTVMENAGSAPVVILKTRASSYSKINVQSVDGTAKAGIDFKPVNVTLTLANNATSTRLPIAIIDNAAYQGSRQFSLKVAVLRFGQVRRATRRSR
jgi:hypothetical protein